MNKATAWEAFSECDDIEAFRELARQLSTGEVVDSMGEPADELELLEASKVLANEINAYCDHVEAKQEQDSDLRDDAS